MAYKSEQDAQELNLIRNPQQDYEDNGTEIDLAGLFYRLLEKFHWIVIVAIIFLH